MILGHRERLYLRCYHAKFYDRLVLQLFSRCDNARILISKNVGILI